MCEDIRNAGVIELAEQTAVYIERGPDTVQNENTRPQTHTEPDSSAFPVAS